MITSEQVERLWNYIFEHNIKEAYKLYEQMLGEISQQEELTTKVKRYFEISSGNIGDNLDEYRRLEKEIKEMVGIEE